MYFDLVHKKMSNFLGGVPAGGLNVVSVSTIKV